MLNQKLKNANIHMYIVNQNWRNVFFAILKEGNIMRLNAFVN
jgi:hypothetical protein